MQPPILRRLPRRPLAEKPVRTLTYNSEALRHSARPQLPFLAPPSVAHRRRRPPPQSSRYLTTETKKWLGDKVLKTARWSVSTYLIICAIILSGWVFRQELLEREAPTPPEWSWASRNQKRQFLEYIRGWWYGPAIEWSSLMKRTTELLALLEDEKGDGQGVRDVGPPSPPGAKDISAKSEPWRRGYYETLLLYAQASERVVGWVFDPKAAWMGPADVVPGPSNPNPKPLPRGSRRFPHEEDCVPTGFPTPDECYPKILATKGLTTRQRMDAALAYAHWLERTGALGPAAVMYEEALNMAVGQLPTSPDAPPLLDPKTLVLNNDSAGRPPSANLLKALTAMATFKARHDDVEGALPIFVSVLAARRALPRTKTTRQRDDEMRVAYLRTRGPLRAFLDFVTTPPYPPPPPDGSAPPERDHKELCEEAALDLHIGEILFARKPATREQGWAWTREGVDLAEGALYKLVHLDRRSVRDATKTCRECLDTGLSNWSTMVKRMAREQEEAQEKADARWFRLWSSGGGAAEEANVDRWVEERKLCEERTAKAQDLLLDFQPNITWSDIFKKD